MSNTSVNLNKQAVFERRGLIIQGPPGLLRVIAYSVPVPPGLLTDIIA